MRALIALAAIPLLTAASDISHRSPLEPHCRSGSEATSTRETGRPKKLGELPPGRPWRAVYRLEDGCPKPVALPVAGRRR